MNSWSMRPISVKNGDLGNRRGERVDVIWSHTDHRRREETQDRERGRRTKEESHLRHRGQTCQVENHRRLQCDVRVRCTCSRLDRSAGQESSFPVTSSEPNIVPDTEKVPGKYLLN